MTYRDLLRWINTFSDEQLNSDVTYYDMATDTYVPIENTVIADDDVVTDQPVLVINDSPRYPAMIN